jgi:hypothetical protein
MTALAGRKADFYVTSGAPIALTDEPMSDVTANFLQFPAQLARTVYAMTNGVKRYMDVATAPVFQRSLDSGSTWPAVTPDIVEAGHIRFLASQQAAPAAQFRVHSGNYLPYARVGGGHEWGATPAQDIKDTTEFGATSRTHTVLQLQGGPVTVKRYYLDDSIRSLLGSLFVIVLWIDDTSQPAGPRYEAFARLRSDAIKVPTTDVESEDLTFELQSVLTYFSA